MTVMTPAPHPEEDLQALWLALRERLAARQLLGAQASLSLRVPGRDVLWFGSAGDAAPWRLAWRGLGAGALHARVYAARDDVCAVLHGGGPFGSLLADFGGDMPGVFDEQVRHLGRRVAVCDEAGLPDALRPGGNALLLDRQPLLLGMTGARLGLNAELFEKCAKAYVLAVAGGGRVRPLPWVVRHVAGGRLVKDERRARLRVRSGLLPQESKGY